MNNDYCDVIDDEGDNGNDVGDDEVFTTATVDPALATMLPMHSERMNWKCFHHENQP